MHDHVEMDCFKRTEDCKGYIDYFFHFKGFQIGCVYTALTALLFSGID